MLNKKRLTIAVMFLSFTFLGSAAGNTEESIDLADAHAKADLDIQVAIAKASKAWKDAFNSGNAAAATALYEEGAVMVVKPFGTFKGKTEILEFWTDLIEKGFDDVVYRNTVITTMNGSARVSADWRMNNASGIITNELWVVQPDGKALLREDHFEVFE